MSGAPTSGEPSGGEGDDYESDEYEEDMAEAAQQFDNSEQVQATTEENTEQGVPEHGQTDLTHAEVGHSEIEQPPEAMMHFPRKDQMETAQVEMTQSPTEDEVDSGYPDGNDDDDDEEAAEPLSQEQPVG